MPRALATLALLLASAVVSLGLAELVARLVVPDGWFIWPPGLESESELAPGLVRGVSGVARVEISSLGLRGDEPTGRERVRILALGGSTTISLYLDQSEMWTHLVQERLNEALGAGAVWIGNGGRAGHGTHQHRLQAEKLLEQLDHIDLLLMLVGANDMMVSASWRLESEQDRREHGMGGARRPAVDELKLAFSVIPRALEPGPWYRRTALARLWARGNGAPPQGPTQDAHGEFVRVLRMHRRQASRIVEKIPGLEDAAAGYAHRLGEIADIAAAHGTGFVPITQPVLWSPDLPPEAREQLLFGGPPLSRARPGAPYYSVEALAEGMEAYNTALLGFCEERGLFCIDAASAMPKDPRLFWDDMHHTEEGARLFARIVASELLRGPLATGAGGSP